MPALVMFGRRWGIASDDFVFPGGFEIFLRLVWLLFVLLAYFLEETVEPNDCGNSYHNLDAFLLGSMALQGIIFLTASCIVVISALGTLSDDRPRRRLYLFLYARCFLFLPEIGLAVFGAFYLVSSGILGIASCPPLIRAACVGGVSLSVVVLFVTIIIVLVIFDPLGASNRIRDRRRTSTLEADSEQAMVDRRRAERRNLWETRLRILCCCCLSDSDENRSALNDVADLMTELFELEQDVVPSDVAAGLVLVQKRQELEPPPSRSPVPLFPRSVKPLPWMTASNVYYYSKFAMSIYSWPLFCFMHPWTGPCRLLNKIPSCCGGPHKDDAREGSIVGNKCCGLAGLRAILGLPHVEILHCSFENHRVFSSPFMVAVDDEAKAVIIAVRGTMSFTDAITDVMTRCGPIFDEDQSCSSLLSHCGILRATDNLLEFLNKNGVLDAARQGREDYSIVTTGHSLGAGIAAILALKLRRDFSRRGDDSAPDIRCFAFSPPGGLLSAAATDLARQTVLSIVLDQDFIPRLSYHTFLKLQEDLAREIEIADGPKFEILAKGCWSAFGRCAVECCGRGRLRGNVEDEEAITRSAAVEEQNDENPLLIVGGQSNYTDEMLTQEGPDSFPASNDCLRSQPKLYPPGQILLLKEHQRGVAHGKWVGPEHFQEIIVGTTMMTDHLPDRVLGAVRSYHETQKNGLSLV